MQIFGLTVLPGHSCLLVLVFVPNVCLRACEGAAIPAGLGTSRAPRGTVHKKVLFQFQVERLSVRGVGSCCVLV
jgi:hypothetical protein